MKMVKYINNINQLSTRKLNILSRKIVQEYMPKYIHKNIMIQSSIVRKQTNKISDKTIKEIISQNFDCDFVSYRNRFVDSYKIRIQQVKNEYDGTLYCVYFSDKISIYYIDKSNYHNVGSYSTKQHKNNSNEAQISFYKSNIQTLKRYNVKNISYDKLV